MTSEEFQIRAAEPVDHAVVVSLLDELISELGPQDLYEVVQPRLAADIAQALTSPEVCIFVAEISGQTIGLARADILRHDPIFRLRPDHRCGYVDQMFVRPVFRGRGLGAQLLSSCEDWFRAQHIEYVVLHAAPRAVRFYSIRGYSANREMFKRL